MRPNDALITVDVLLNVFKDPDRREIALPEQCAHRRSSPQYDFVHMVGKLTKERIRSCARIAGTSRGVALTIFCDWTAMSQQLLTTSPTT